MTAIDSQLAFISALLENNCECNSRVSHFTGCEGCVFNEQKKIGTRSHCVFLIATLKDIARQRAEGKLEELRKLEWLATLKQKPS